MDSFANRRVQNLNFGAVLILPQRTFRVRSQRRLRAGAQRRDFSTHAATYWLAIGSTVDSTVLNASLRARLRSCFDGRNHSVRRGRQGVEPCTERAEGIIDCIQDRRRGRN